MALPPETVGWVLVGLAILTVLLVVVTAALSVMLRRLRRAYAAVIDPGREDDIFDVLRRYRDEVERVREDVGVVHGNTEHLRELLRSTVSKVGVVRYDAFEDMGGALSFSAALLDERGDGVVISAINGRSETRAYAKPVSGGVSEHHLTPEEEQAIRAVVPGGRRSLDGRRRRRAAS